MVGPPSAAERAANRRRVAIGLVGLVALSTALSAAYGGAEPVEVVLLTVVGAVVGVALVVSLRAWP